MHVKRKKFGDITYQEKINSYESFDDQLFFEMENAGARGIEEMVSWDYNNSSMFEAKYEDLIIDEELKLFHNIFTFLGFPGFCIPKILEIAHNNSLFSGQLKNSVHIRSGKSKQWEKYFTANHKQRFIDLFGDALIKLGYESDDDWVYR